MEMLLCKEAWIYSAVCVWVMLGGFLFALRCVQIGLRETPLSAVE